MSQEPTAPIVFDEARAATYDQRAAKLAPTRDALHLLTRAVLGGLPAEADILCVGLGTGAELIDLAQAFPHWRFTAVEPAPAMLDACRRAVDARGLTARCTFHAGYLETLPPSDPFDAATCFLVSQFFVRPDDRRDFFRRIAARLRPQGILVSSDLSADRSAPTYPGLEAVWLRMLRTAGFPDDELEQFRASYGRDVGVLPPPEVEAILAAAGFEAPTLFFQNLLIRAWFSRRAA